MGLLSPFQRKTSPAAPQGGDEVQRARTRARQRLIGAVVLVGIGIVGFPLLFETHPRPIPVDLPISIANKDKVAPLALPPARAPQGAASATLAPATRASSGIIGAAVIDEAASNAGREVAAAPASAPTPAAPVHKAEAKPATTKAATKPREESRNATPSEGRYALQVGAYAEAASARQARQRVEKLGLKTYTQVVETQAGSRIRVRVGPFASRDEADRAAGKLKSAGLPVALLTL